MIKQQKSPIHKLLILSTDSREYRHYIERAHLPGLSICEAQDLQHALPLGLECDLVFGEPSIVSQVVNHLPHLQWVQSSWAGTEPMFAPDLRRDYILTNARNVYGEMMAEYVFGYLLLIERQIIQRWQAQLDRTWDSSPHGRLKGKQIGLMGVGSIGHSLASTAHHFGMIVYGYTLSSETCQNVDHYFHPDKLAEFAKGLDYLVCSLPGTPATKGMINATVLATLPRTAWVINIGRGSTIDEMALVEALNMHSVAGAVLDVFVEEPLPADHPFWNTPNTYITCHTAAKNHPPDIAALFIDNYKRFVDGRPLLYQVDFDKQY
jgi:phosphoglycerate dehydrogenase-like enzyme